MWQQFLCSLLTTLVPGCSLPKWAAPVEKHTPLPSLSRGLQILLCLRTENIWGSDGPHRRFLPKYLLSYKTLTEESFFPSRTVVSFCPLPIKKAHSSCDCRLGASEAESSGQSFQGIIPEDWWQRTALCQLTARPGLPLCTGQPSGSLALGKLPVPALHRFLP